MSNQPAEQDERIEQIKAELQDGGFIFHLEQRGGSDAWRVSIASTDQQVGFGSTFTGRTAIEAAEVRFGAFVEAGELKPNN